MPTGVVAPEVLRDRSTRLGNTDRKFAKNPSIREKGQRTARVSSNGLGGVQGEPRTHEKTQALGQSDDSSAWTGAALRQLRKGLLRSD